MPGGLWQKCPKCSELLYAKELENNLRVCPKCDHHFRLRARERIAQISDPDSFAEWDANIQPADPLQFEDGSGSYADKLQSTQAKSGEQEALITGTASTPVSLAGIWGGLGPASLAGFQGMVERTTGGVTWATLHWLLSLPAWLPLGLLGILLLLTGRRRSRGGFD